MSNYDYLSLRESTRLLTLCWMVNYKPNSQRKPLAIDLCAIQNESKRLSEGEEKEKEKEEDDEENE